MAKRRRTLCWVGPFYSDVCALCFRPRPRALTVRALPVGVGVLPWAHNACDSQSDWDSLSPTLPVAPVAIQESRDPGWSE